MAAPITGLYAGLLGLLVIVLAARVVLVRRASGIGLGDTGNDVLQRRVRAHANAVEYVPLALILFLLLELDGTGALTLHVLGAGLLVGRIGHAQGLTQSAGDSPGRFIGTTLTWITITAASALLIVRFAA